MAVKGVGDVAVSPDGKRIAYVVTERSTESNVTNSDVWVVSVTGGDARRVTSGPRADRAPQWSNDGSWIAFLSDRAENRRTQVYGIDPSGGEAWQITRHESAVGSFRLSPDAKRVAYLCVRAGVARRTGPRQGSRQGDRARQRVRRRVHAAVGSGTEGSGSG